MNAQDPFGPSLPPAWASALFAFCFAGTAVFVGFVRRQWRISGPSAFQGATVLRLDIAAIGMGWLAFAAVLLAGGPMPLQTAGVTCAFCSCLAAGSPPWRTLGLHRWSWQGIGMIPATYMALILPLNGALWISWLLCQALAIPFESQPLIEHFAQLHGFRAVAGFVLMATVAAPLGEELFFRVFLHGWFCSWMPRWTSWLATTALFASAHWHAPTFLPLFLLGGLLMFLYEITGSIWTSILLHALFNGVTLLVALHMPPAT